MRLICPNCGAQYEVAADSVPASGRDVQCSNCGHTWLELPGSSVAAEQELSSAGSTVAGAAAGAAASAAASVRGAADAGGVTDGFEKFSEGAQAQVDSGKDAISGLGSQAGDMAADAMDNAASAAGDLTGAVTDRAGDLAGSASDAASGIVGSATDAAGGLADTAKDAASGVTASATDAAGNLADKAMNVADGASDAVGRAVPKHELEDSVADILRQEADRELGARETEISSLETQTDIPMDQPENDSASETRDRLAKIMGEDSTAAANAAAVSAVAAAAAATASASGKEILPDVDEINSTLRTNAERGESVAPPPEQVERSKRKGFRWGFWGILLLILLAVLIYLFADRIIGMAPASEGAVTGYVDSIDGVRGWVNARAESAITSLETGTTTAARE